MINLKKLVSLSALLAAPFACSSEDKPLEVSGPPCQNELEGQCGDDCTEDADCSAGTFCYAANSGDGYCTADCTPSGNQCSLQGATCDARGRCTLTGNTGGGGTTGGGGGGIREIDPNDPPPFDECAGWQDEPEVGPAVLMLVVDVSGSMGRNPVTNDNQPPSKWSITQTALSVAIAALPATTGVGVLYYPNVQGGIDQSDEPRDPDACVNSNALIPIDRLGQSGSGHRMTIEQSLDKDPADGTPTHDAYDIGLAHLLDTSLDGSRNLVLITDGEPTYSQQCVGNGRDGRDTDPIIDAIAAASSQDVRTFIIGSPGSEVAGNTMGMNPEDRRPWLSQAAETGGTSRGNCTHSGEPYCHFDMSVEADFGTGLSDALAAISGEVVACDVALPTAPPGEDLDSDLVNVVLTSSDGTSYLVGRDDTGAGCDEGWYYSDGGMRVTLCEATCNRILGDPGSSLEMTFGCGTEVIVE